MTDIQFIVQLYASDDFEGMYNFIRQCNPTGTTDMALKFIELRQPVSAMSALNALALGYRQDGQLPLAEVMSTANVELGVAKIKRFGVTSSTDYVEPTVTALSHLANSLLSQGKTRQLIDFAASIREQFTALELQHLLGPFYLSVTEAYLASGQFDRAKVLFDEIRNYPFGPADQIQRDFVANRLERGLTAKATELRETQLNEVDRAAQQKAPLVAQLEAFRAQMTGSPEHVAMIDQLLTRVRNMDAGTEQEVLEQSSQIANLAMEMLQQLGGATPGSGSSIDQLRKRIRDTSEVLMDPARKNAPAALRQALKVFQEIYPQVADQFPDDANDVLWTMSICHIRLQERPEAVGHLQSLRENLETIRSQIRNPMERAAIMSKYKYLFHNLTQQLCYLDRPPELLDAIEGSKGRILADIMADKKDAELNSTTLRPALQQLPTRLKKLRAHYLTYFIDDAESYAVLCTADGQLISKLIPFGRRQLLQWINSVDINNSTINPANWGKKSGFFGPPMVNLSLQLTPLTDWLQPLMQQGILQKEDHLCYCPDEELHLVPLHYLPLEGQPLIHSFSVSKIHGALALTELLEHSPEPPPYFEAWEVPSAKEIEIGSHVAKLEAFGRAASWLSDNLPGTIYKYRQADLQQLLSSTPTRRLLHFSTHGVFPNQDHYEHSDQVNPYTASGILLAHQGHLPELQLGDYSQNPYLLSPRQIIESDLDLSGSHVSLQACVSGLAKEGIGGDALGLEWAIMLAGAQSLLSSHWNVDAIYSAGFFERFYSYWLNGGYSRAQALRKCMLEDIQGGLSPYYWAAFSLSGDWR